jgi:putative restriction endonuclease
MNPPSDLDWLTAMRVELEWYREQHAESDVSLDELYDFSEKRLARQFPENNHVRDKMRQVLQRLRDRGEIKFLDNDGEYRVLEIDLEKPPTAYLHISTDAEPPREEIDREKSELIRATESEPELSEKDTEYIETRRKARGHAFRELVREEYNNTCAVCGSQRVSPYGNPEVEAAHIYPKSEDGSDDIRNGIALCKFHHWAFDSGWLSVTNDYEITVADAPDKNGYDELKQFEGRSLRLPENEDVHPHPIFLERHREIQYFD